MCAFPVIFPPKTPEWFAIKNNKTIMTIALSDTIVAKPGVEFDLLRIPKAFPSSVHMKLSSIESDPWPP